MNIPIIRFVVFRYGHHSPHSGYSRLAEYGVKQYDGEIIRVAKPLPRSIIRERMYWRLARGTPGYDRASMAAELNVALSILGKPAGIYHFLYGETTYHYAAYLNNLRNNRIVASFHKPPDEFRHAVQIDWHLRRLSAAICLGHNQQECFENLLDKDRIFYIPLGVDTEYFTPPDTYESRDPNLCICVGEKFRDFLTLRGVIELVSYLRPKTRFVAVMPSRSFNLLGSHSNLTLLSSIPEAQLLELYRTAAIMIHPLKDAVANNGLLEGMACGLPAVVTEVGAVRDYVTSESAILVPPNDSRTMAETLLNLLDESVEQQKISEKAREQAQKFSWPIVVSQLESVYKKVA